MRIFSLLLSFIYVLAFSIEATAQPTFSFSQAKKLLEKHVYTEAEERQTFYCGCTFSQDKQVDGQSCGYTPRKNAKRGKRIEWEHIVPAARFGQQRVCWQQGDAACVTRKGKSYKGRRCCAKVDPEFRQMEADLHNLVPAVGELNGDRSNYRMAEISGEARNYGACDFEVDRKKRIAEPMGAVRGEVARAYLYMRDTYGLDLTPEEEEMFTGWAENDPVSEWEIERNKRILRLQGNVNPHIFSGS